MRLVENCSSRDLKCASVLCRRVDRLIRQFVLDASGTLLALWSVRSEPPVLDISEADPFSDRVLKYCEGR